MPCGLRGQLEVSSIDPWPQPWTTLPGASNSMTGGAAAQQVAVGGVCCADVSSSVSVSGRCVTQTCCFESTNTPVTAPRIQLFGISSGHDGSTLKDGTAAPWPWTCGAIRTAASAQPVTAAEISVKAVDMGDDFTLY